MGQLKKAVASQCNNDINAYCDGKSSFIQMYEAKALEWKRKIRKSAKLRLVSVKSTRFFNADATKQKALSRSHR